MFLLILPLLLNLYLGAPTIPQSETVDCTRLIQQLQAEPDWLDKLADPVINSDNEHKQRYGFYSLVYECLRQQPGSLSDDLQAAYLLTAYYLTFLEQAPDTLHNSLLWIVDPATFPDPALERLRSEVGLKPPPGRFYLRLYPSRLDLPLAVQSIFDNQNAFGVTILSRYIAVVVIDSIGWKGDQSVDAETGGTISHELVHAFVNASVGALQARRPARLVPGRPGAVLQRFAALRLPGHGSLIRAQAARGLPGLPGKHAVPGKETR